MESGDEHNCALRDDGHVECWNDDDPNPYFSTSDPGNPRGTFSQIDVGSSIGCGVTPGGCVACWVNNYYKGEPEYSLNPPTPTEDHPLCSLDELSGLDPATDQDFF